MKDIYDMKLHEFTTLAEDGDNGLSILRVPGGWIYSIAMRDKFDSIFVPWHDSGRLIESNDANDKVRVQLTKSDRVLHEIRQLINKPVNHVMEINAVLTKYYAAEIGNK